MALHGASANRKCISRRCTVSPATFHGLARHAKACIKVRNWTAQRCLYFSQHGRTQEAEKSRSCTDQLTCTELHGPAQTRRCTELHGKRASGFRISRICTVQHGRSLFIWILIWHCLWSSIHMSLNLSLPMELHQDPAKSRAMAFTAQRCPWQA